MICISEPHRGQVKKSISQTFLISSLQVFKGARGSFYGVSLRFRLSDRTPRWWGVVRPLKKERPFGLKRCEASHYLYGPIKKKTTSKL